MRIKIVLIVCLLALADAVHATDHVWLIGGGPDPDNSQVSIEKNVIWIRKILDRLPDDRVVHVYFNDGHGDAPDIVQETSGVRQDLDLTPLARVFGQQQAERQEYRNNDIRDITGGTWKKELLSALERDLSSVGAGDPVLFVFNGHGLRAESPEEGNTIRVWGDETISVRELEEVFSGVDPAVPVRFIFPQCYSGGFFRLVNREAVDGLHLAKATRCGFFAESEKRTSEG